MCMKINNKGFTLVELLAVMVILGVVMAVTIPNIVGISNRNKITTYAEDAKKFKNTAEYMFRGDDTIIKPQNNGECSVVNLGYLHENEFDNPPYGGRYLMDHSIVVMVKKNNQYKYYVQLIEMFQEKEGASYTTYYRGFKLLDYAQLEGDKYLNQLTEKSAANGTADSLFVNLKTYKSNKTGLKSKITSVTGCTSVVAIYYAEK